MARTCVYKAMLMKLPFYLCSLLNKTHMVIGHRIISFFLQTTGKTVANTVPHTNRMHNTTFNFQTSLILVEGKLCVADILDVACDCVL